MMTQMNERRVREEPFYVSSKIDASYGLKTMASDKEVCRAAPPDVVVTLNKKNGRLYGTGFRLENWPVRECEKSASNFWALSGTPDVLDSRVDRALVTQSS